MSTIIGNYRYEISTQRDEWGVPYCEYVILKLKNRQENLWEVQVLDKLPTVAMAAMECQNIINKLQYQEEHGW